MMKSGSGDTIVLMDDARIKRTLKRISFEIIEQNQTDAPLYFAGLNQRGFVTAERIRTYVNEAGFSTKSVFPIDAHKSYDSQSNDLPDLSGKNVIMVDDVIFSGKTMLRALGYMLKKGEPDKIQIAVLVDRGHRMYPVQPTYVGLHYPTKLKEHVHVAFGGHPETMSVILNSDYGI